MSESNLILPGNPRYQPKKMEQSFGYDYLYYGLAKVEVATLQTLGEIGVIPQREIETLTPQIIEKLLAIPTTDVDKIENEITHHDVRAWVRKAQKIVRKAIAQWLHIPLTSYDPLDTGRIIQFQMAYRSAISPSVEEVVYILAGVVRKLADQLQIGRTHGKHALPITSGFWLATILSRILYNWRQTNMYYQGLVGKITGAVGACNAQIGLQFSQRCGQKSFEQRILEKIGLKPARISTQILPPEPLGYFLFSNCMMSASLGQFGRDCRHLMRTEIDEVREPFEKDQIGSSTMGQKRNPINFENLEGMWIKTKNEFGKVFDTLISEHQRDLVGSCVARDFPIILINLQKQLDTLLKRDKKNNIPFLERITVDAEACKKNFEMSFGLILAEPIYIALKMAGYQGDSHKFVTKKMVPRAEDEDKSLAEILQQFASEDPDFKEVVDNIPKEVADLFWHPEKYTGNAKEKALEIAEYAEKQITELTV